MLLHYMAAWSVGTSEPIPSAKLFWIGPAITVPQSERKFAVPDEKNAAKGTCYFNWLPEKNRIEDVETSHAILP